MELNQLEFQMHIKINRHRDGWKKFIGGKRFYSPVGMDSETFRRLAGALQVRWSIISVSGGEWTEQEIDAAYDAAGIPRNRIGNGTKHTRDHLSGRSHAPAARSHNCLFLYAAIEKYLSQLKTEVPKQISIDHYEKMDQQVRRLKKLMPDIPIDQIEYDDLVRVKNTVINGKKVNGDPYAIDTITTIIGCIKTFFNYLADSTDWQAPRGFDKAMKVDRSRLAAAIDDDDEDDDLDADEANAFTPKELAYLWGVATTDLGKLILGLGLFAGFTATDIATLRKSMIVIEGDNLYIFRKRQKTKHKQKYKTKWWVPPEVATLIRRYLLSTSDNPEVNPKELLILTCNKLPMVHRGRNGTGRKTDNVRAVWESMIRAAHKSNESRTLSHKYLRKSGGRFIWYGIHEWKGDGLEVAQQFLAHALKTVAEKNYLGRPDFSDLHAAQRRLYEHLSPIMFGKNGRNPQVTGVLNVA